MSGMKILIISEYIAPVQHIAAIRWTKYAKYLAKDHGCEVTVLTNKKCFDGSSMTKKQYKYDESLTEDLEWFNVAYIPSTLRQAIANGVFSLGYQMLNRIRSSPKSGDVDSDEANGRSFINRFVKPLLSHNIPERIFECVDWACGSALVAAGRKCDLDYGSFQVVISSYGPRWPHDLARRIKTIYPHMKWIADFRDSVVVSDRTNTEHNRKIAGILANNCDMVTSVSGGTIECLHLNSSIPAEVLTNGFDAPSEIGGQNGAQEKFRIVYTGTIYSDSNNRQDLTPIFEAISQLISSGVIDKTDVLVDYAGPSSHLFLRAAESFKDVATNNHGLLSRRDAVSLQDDASILLVAACNTKTRIGVLTGKIFEYMVKPVPIVGLISGEVPDSDLKRLIDETKVGFCFEEARADCDQIALEQFISQAYRQWKQFGFVSRSEESRCLVERYSYKNLSKRLMEIINRVMLN